MRMNSSTHTASAGGVGSARGSGHSLGNRVGTSSISNHPAATKAMASARERSPRRRTSQTNGTNNQYQPHQISAPDLKPRLSETPTGDGELLENAILEGDSELVNADTYALALINEFHEKKKALLRFQEEKRNRSGRIQELRDTKSALEQEMDLIVTELDDLESRDPETDKGMEENLVEEFRIVANKLYRS